MTDVTVVFELVVVVVALMIILLALAGIYEHEKYQSEADYQQILLLQQILAKNGTAP